MKSLVLFFLVLAAAWSGAQTPNVIVILADDLGYADVGAFGAKGYATPNFDRLAREGRKFTDFYVSSAVCSASRAALLTGCCHERVGVRGAFGPKSKTGLNPAEVTIAEMLKAHGYATGMAGKWHLGEAPGLLPTAQGFDEWLGLPYSSDMWPHHPESPKAYPPLPLYEGTAAGGGAKVIDDEVTPDELRPLVNRYADRATDFIRRNKERPFFFYFASHTPHVPLMVSGEFAGKGGSGTYSDIITELDAAVGRILAVLDETKLAEKTLILFTSDNGPWLSYGNHAGSAGPLREGKGTSLDGGVRVPMIARWPGRIPAGTSCAEPLMTIDFLPTIAAQTGAKLPEAKLDGRDISPLLLGQEGAKNPHEALFFYYADNQLQAMRAGKWKLLFPHTARTMKGRAPGKDGIPGKYAPLPVGTELYDLSADIGETKNLADSQPEVMARLNRLADAERVELGDSLKKMKGTEVRPAGRVE